MTTPPPRSRPRAHRPLQDAPDPEALLTERERAPAPPRRRFRPTLETVLLASTATLLAAVAWPIATSGTSVTASPDPVPMRAVPSTAPTIQIALLLDTSSSMNGLLDQARSQLWRVVNALDSATFHGATPKLEIALYEYGNDHLPAASSYIRQVSGFTVELDRVSEALFSLQTVGGEEYAGAVIARSLDELEWHEGPGTLKVVYIAGNESFAQGPIAWQSSVERAAAKGIIVNTVLCNGADDHWSQAAALAGGKFMAIDHDAVAQYVAAPQDEEIARLGQQINATSVHYGSEGKLGYDNQQMQDGNAVSFGPGSSIQRALTKGSANYVNPSWDLVDATDQGTVALEDIDKSTLPEALREKSTDEIRAEVATRKADRARLKSKLAKLSAERDAFVTAERDRRSGEDPDRLDTAIVASVVEQAKAAGFTIGSADNPDA